MWPWLPVFIIQVSRVFLSSGETTDLTKQHGVYNQPAYWGLNVYLLIKNMIFNVVNQRQPTPFNGLILTTHF